VVTPGILAQRHARFHPVAKDHSLQGLAERRPRPMPGHPAELGLGAQQSGHAPTPTHVAVTPPRLPGRHGPRHRHGALARMGRHRGVGGSSAATPADERPSCDSQRHGRHHRPDRSRQRCALRCRRPRPTTGGRARPDRPDRRPPGPQFRTDPGAPWRGPAANPGGSPGPIDRACRTVRRRGGPHQRLLPEVLPVPIGLAPWCYCRCPPASTSVWPVTQPASSEA
jgi:hypothetical protein